MSVEISVYSAETPLKGAEIIAAAAKEQLELRLLIPFKCIVLAPEALQQPPKKQDLMVYCWPKRDTKTTAILDEALQKGDTSLILSVQDKIGWFDFRCEKYDYDRYWKKYADEKEEFEESVSAEVLKAMRSAKVRYFFRCGLRPQENANYLDKVAKMVRDLTNGYLGE
ncbi:MAG TPA: hypothetical protein VMM76_04790 [Pirellulaceae bacterium]|nr:hypothetical protein [Pirellulaceae bacterium]